MSEEPNEDSSPNWKVSLLLCLIIAAVTAGVLKYIYSTEPKIQRVGATRKSAMLVDVIEVKRRSYHPILSVLGTVKPAIEIDLSPQVSGEIVQKSDNFTPGSYIKKNELLFQIDQKDYQTELTFKKSELLQSESELQIEMGRQSVAKHEYDIHGKELSKDNQELVLRRPQLSNAKAKVAYAKAAVKKAELDLSRTQISAPFNAQVLSLDKNLGSQVDSGEKLGRIIGVDEYWVLTSLPTSQIKWLDIPDHNNPLASKAVLHHHSSWAQNTSREGVVSHLIGQIDDSTRLAQILITVKDPLSLRKENITSPKLMIGSFLNIDIKGKEIKNVFRLERHLIRKNESAWIMDGDELKIKKLSILFRDAKYAYIKDGLNEGDKIVTSNLSRVIEGAKLRLASNTSKESLHK